LLPHAATINETANNDAATRIALLCFFMYSTSPSNEVGRHPHV
jgi:hypothetical protein